MTAHRLLIGPCPSKERRLPANDDCGAPGYDYAAVHGRIADSRGLQSAHKHSRRAFGNNIRRPGADGLVGDARLRLTAYDHSRAAGRNDWPPHMRHWPVKGRASMHIGNSRSRRHEDLLPLGMENGNMLN